MLLSAFVCEALQPDPLHPSSPRFSIHGFVGRARRSTGTSCGVPAALAAADEDWSVEGCDEGMGDGQAPWHMAVAVVCALGFHA